MALGLVTAAVTTVLPLAPLLMVIVALLMAAVGTLDRSDLARWERAVPTAIGASAIAFVLHLPWAIGLLLPLPSWSEIVGPVSTAGGPVALRDLVWLDLGPNSFGLVLVGLHLAGVRHPRRSGVAVSTGPRRDGRSLWSVGCSPGWARRASGRCCLHRR